MTPHVNCELLDYELLDYGKGRKLERFGSVVCDRPCPAADGVQPAAPMLWATADAKFNRTRGEQGTWKNIGKLPSDWQVSFPIDEKVGELCFELQPSPFGHVGVFAEQAANWRWIAKQIRRIGPMKVLNLFAYTGGSTLAAAAAGAEVVHIDAAENILKRARRNAELSGLSECPIRWIAEDALKFCQREVKRGNRYDAVILDPPSYGHGPKGEPWKIDHDLLPLVELCGELTDRRPKFLLTTCHSPNIGPAELAAYLSDGIFGSCGQPPATGELALQTKPGRKLPCGVFARWPR